MLHKKVDSLSTHTHLEFRLGCVESMRRIRQQNWHYEEQNTCILALPYISSHFCFTKY